MQSVCKWQVNTFILKISLIEKKCMLYSLIVGYKRWKHTGQQILPLHSPAPVFSEFIGWNTLPIKFILRLLLFFSTLRCSIKANGGKKQDYVFHVHKHITIVCAFSTLFEGLTDKAKQSFNGKHGASKKAAFAVMTDVCPSGCLVKWSVTDCACRGCYWERSNLQRLLHAFSHFWAGRTGKGNVHDVFI